MTQRVDSKFFAWILIIFLWIIQSAIVYAVKCVDCEGLYCFGPECDGDYCMISVYSPKVGSKIKLGEQNIVKGCVTGNLLKESINDECERFDENDQEVQMCMCDDANFCNHKIFMDKIRSQKTPLVTCKCNECGTQTTCMGEYCTYTVNNEDGEVTQGCSNRSLPLIERMGIGACIQPAMSPSFIITPIDSEFDRGTCVCAENYCNKESLDILETNQVECDMSVKMNALFFQIDRPSMGKCKGEHCFDVEMTSHDGSFYAAKGCMSFVEGRQGQKELNEEGCMYFKSSVINMKACFGTEKGIDGQKANQEEEKVDDGNKKDTQAQPTNEVRRPGMHHHIAGNQAEKEEGEAGAAALERKPPVNVDGTKNDGEPDGPHYDGNTTTLVAVFVLIVVLLALISGAIWKFELHKKIFHTRYRTVARG